MTSRGQQGDAGVSVFPAIQTQQPALLAGVVATIALLLALALIARGLDDGVTFAAFLGDVVALALLAVAVLAGYWATAIANLRYEIGHGALTIVWGLSRQVVPVDMMQRIIRGRAVGRPAVDGLWFPGWTCNVGTAYLPRLGRALIYSSHRTPDHLLYIVTSGLTYGVSPADPAAFIAEVQRALALPPNPEVRREVIRHPLADLPHWTDKRALALAGTLLLVTLVAIGVVFARYSGLSERTVLRFPADDTSGSRRALLGIPITAAVLLLLNVGAAAALFRPLRAVAYTFLVGGTFVGALLVVAAFAAA